METIRATGAACTWRVAASLIAIGAERGLDLPPGVKVTERKHGGSGTAH